VGAGAGVTQRGTWKAEERRLADDLGGRRIPVTGIDRDAADVVTPLFLVQSKLRRALPAWLWSWLNPIAATANESGRIGILVLRTPRMRKADALVVIKYSDFQSLHGVVAPETGSER
jgi:hypothetical protein